MSSGLPQAVEIERVVHHLHRLPGDRASAPGAVLKRFAHPRHVALVVRAKLPYGLDKFVRHSRQSILELGIVGAVALVAVLQVARLGRVALGTEVADDLIRLDVDRFF